jgi:hypothetical protein
MEFLNYLPLPDSIKDEVIAEQQEKQNKIRTA